MGSGIRYFGLRGSSLHRAIWTESCIAIMIFTYNQAALPNLVTLPTFYNQFPQINTVSSPQGQRAHKGVIQGTVISIYVLAGAFGALGCTFLGDRLGRRWTIWFSCLVQGIGCVLQASAFDLAQLVIARLILGLGTGGIIATVSVWQAETAKANSRGEHVSSFGIFCSLGLILCLWLEFGCSYITGPASWRFPLTIPILLGGTVMAFIFKLPESPRWLVKVGRVKEAAEVMSIIYDSTPDDDNIAKEIQDMQISLEMSASASLQAMFQMGPQRTFHRTCLAGVIQMFLQLSGTNAVIFYSTTLFELQLGFSPTTSRILAASLQFALVLGSIVCSYTVDRVGRRKLLIISATLSAISMGCLAGLTSNPTNTAALKAGAFFVFFYEFVYCIGFLGIPFLYASEVAPAHLRAAICGVSTAVSWLFNYLVTQITPVGFASISWKYFLIYLSTNAAAAVIVFFFYPETAGRSLEEIDQIFAASKSIFDPVRISHTLRKQRLAALVEEDSKEMNSGVASERIELVPPTLREAK